MIKAVITATFSINGTIYERVDGRENKGNANERERFHQNIFICVMILKGDLKGFQENFETFLKSICHDLTPVNLRARRDKSHAHFFNKQQFWLSAWQTNLS